MFYKQVQEALCLLQEALDTRFGIYNFHPAPTANGYPAWVHDRTETYINLTKGEVDNQVELFFDGRSEGMFRLPMYLGSDGKQWGVLPPHLATLAGEEVIFRVEGLAERRIKGLFCPTDWYCKTKRNLPKGDRLLAYTKITTPAGILYAQRFHQWVAYLPGYFDADSGDGTGQPVLLDKTLNGIKTQLYKLFVEGKMRDVAELSV